MRFKDLRVAILGVLSPKSKSYQGIAVLFGERTSLLFKPLTKKTQVRTMGAIKNDRTVAIYGGELQSDDFDRDSEYVIKIAKGHTNFFLDGSKPTQTIASFINHSCDPNCAIAEYIYNGQLIVVIISLRKIRALEFLSVDYGNLFRTFSVCMCGSPLCRTREKYLSLLSTNMTPTTVFF